MSKYLFAFVLISSLLSINAVSADEVSSTTTKTDNPDYSSSTNSTVTKGEIPTSVKSESTTSESSPYGQKVTSHKSYKKSPAAQRTTSTDTETTTNR